jgi:hypothetical protein
MNHTKLRDSIRRIRENDPTFTSLLDLRNLDASRLVAINRKDRPADDKEGEEDRNVLFQNLCDALAVNTTIQNVNIILRCLFSFTTTDESQHARLYETIGSLAHVTNLRLGHSGFAEESIQLATIAMNYATRHHSLKSLTLHSIHFHDKVVYPKAMMKDDDDDNTMNTDEPDFQNFLEVLGSLAQLESLVLEDMEDRFDLDAVVAVANSKNRLPNLTSLSMRAFHFSSTPRLTQQSLNLLFQSDHNTLETLSPAAPVLISITPRLL